MAFDKDVTATSDEKAVAVAPYDEAEGEDVGALRGNADALKRSLGNRQIQLIAIGGSIGTALFVSIGSGLMDGGPGSLFIAFTLYSCLLGLVNNCMAEMAVYMPISGQPALFSHSVLLTSWELTHACPHRQAPSSALPGNGSTRPSASWPAGTSSSTRPP